MKYGGIYDGPVRKLKANEFNLSSGAPGTNITWFSSDIKANISDPRVVERGAIDGWPIAPPSEKT